MFLPFDQEDTSQNNSEQLTSGILWNEMKSCRFAISRKCHYTYELGGIAERKFKFYFYLN